MTRDNAVHYTPKQGQYLAFIYYYTMINRRAPAESDIQKFFRVSPPSVHQMIVTLERQGFISRISGLGRSIVLNVPREQLPDLTPVDGK
jgi:Mn-dependent DtxR family transcriptional regulator